MAVRGAEPAHVLGVDQGTSSTKALLLDSDARIVATAEHPIAIEHPEPGWVEQDPEAMVANVVRCIRDLVRESGIEPGAIAGLGIDNHTETLVLWERSSGRACIPRLSGSVDAAQPKPTPLRRRRSNGLSEGEQVWILIPPSPQPSLHGFSGIVRTLLTGFGAETSFGVRSTVGSCGA